MIRKTKNINEKLYDIIPSQNAMYLMYKFGIHKQQVQIPTSFSVDCELDFNVLQKAFNIEIERNDSLRLGFVKSGGQVKQYFGSAYEYEVPVKEFASDEEMQAFFDKDAAKPVAFMKGERYRIYFYSVSGGGSGIYTNFSHMLMDAMGIMIFYFDLFKVYLSLKEGAEMPSALHSYESYVAGMLEKNKDEKKQQKHREFYREYFLKGGAPFYAGVHGSGLLEKFREKKKDPSARVPMAYNPLHDKCAMEIFSVSKDDTEKIFEYCTKADISPESIFQLGLRSYCSAVNFRTDDVCMMCVCSNRTSFREKNMSGCMAQPLILRTIIEESTSFEKAAEQLSLTRTALYRHSTFPYTEARDMFLELHKLGPIQGANSMMFSWIPLPYETDLPFEIDFRTYNLERYFTPLYTIVTPDIKTKGIKIYYMYRTKLSDRSQIERLHRNTVEIIRNGIENPDITVGQLLDLVN